MITASRVRDTRKKITSRSALHQAAKARDTLQTAQAILQASGSPQYAIDAIGRDVACLTEAIRDYYDRERSMQ